MAKESETKKVTKKKAVSTKESTKKPVKKKKTQKVIIKEVVEPVSVPEIEIIDEKKLESDTQDIKEISNKIDENLNDAKEKETKIKVYPSFSGTEIIIIVIITAFVSLLIGLVISKPTSNHVNNNSKSYSKEMQDFLTEYQNIVDSYYDYVDEKDLLNKALGTIIDELGDPYSGVIDDSFSNTLETRLQGSYSGFGIEIVNDQDMNIVIYSIIENSPAEKAELKAGDMIVEMDGIEVKGMTTTSFVELVKTKSDKVVELKIIRDGKEMVFSIKRDFIILKSVTSKIIEKNNQKIGYMYINVFATNTDVQFAEVLKNLEKQGMNSLIIDVRGNTGGHLKAVENVLSEFLNKKSVVYQIEEKGKATKYYSKGSTTKKYDIIILGDGGSASASEILIAGLMDSYGAKFVGIKTFGKGTVQEVLTTSTDLQYKLTTKKWLTPKGVWIHGEGIKPDYEVILDSSYYENPSDETDNQLQKAIELLIK